MPISPFINSPGEVRGEPIARDRITVVEMVYHRSASGGEPFVSDSRFSRELGTYEQVYERKHLPVEEGWQKVSLGWVKTCGMLVILNEEGRFSQRNPTDEERSRAKGKVLEVCYGPIPEGANPRPWLVPAGETMRVVPVGVDDLFIRCRSGRAYYTVRAFPA
jgi:hypothetical protein